jgi:hypothetical protein
MIIEVYVALIFIAVYFLKLGLIDRKAELFSFFFSFTLFALLAFSSFNLQAFSESTGATVILDSDSAQFALFIILAIISAVLALLSGLGKLPEGRIDYDHTGRRPN